MSKYDIFMTATATMNKMVVDGFGDETVDSSFTVDIDPVLGRDRIFTTEEEYVDGFNTVIAYNENVDLTHDKWQLVYNGRTYQIEGIEPFYTVGTLNIEHFEVTLR